MRRRYLLLAVLVLLAVGAAAVTVVGQRTPKQGAPEPGAEQTRDEPQPHDARPERRRVHAGSASEASPAYTVGGTPVVEPSGPEEGAIVPPTDGPPEPLVVGQVGGNITDAETGAALGGARVLVTVLTARGTEPHASGEDFVRWWGTTSDAEGRFEQNLDESYRVGTKVRIEIRVAKRGYVSVRAPLGEGPLELRLVRRDRPQVPGSVVGTVTDTDGRPISGILLVSAQDEMQDGFSQWVIADAGGGFVLDGVRPGNWLFRAVPGGEGARAIVPDGGETRVHLHREPSSWPRPMTEDEFERRHAELRFDGERRTDQSAGTEGADELRRMYRLQSLETEWRAQRPTREVVVSGVPAGPGVHVRAAVLWGPQHIWRARARAGTARFDLSHEEWRIVLVRPGHPDVERGVDIEAGEGPLRIDFTDRDER